MKNSILIVGSGTGLSASIARLFSSKGFSVGLAARNIEKLRDLSREIGAIPLSCDVSCPEQVNSMFNLVDQRLGSLKLVVFNPSKRLSGPIETLDAHSVKSAVDITCLGGFLVAQQAVKRMLNNRGGAIFFTGASASIKGFPYSSVFAMGKFGLRGLAQSLARELQPKNIHVAHFVIDGGIRPAEKANTDPENLLLNPDQIAINYYNIFNQDKSCWSWELEVRPWLEKF